jgi:hypothetical protein
MNDSAGTGIAGGSTSRLSNNASSRRNHKRRDSA